MKKFKNKFIILIVGFMMFFSKTTFSNMSIIKKTLIPVYVSWKLFKSIYIFKNLYSVYNKNDTKPHGALGITVLDTAQNHPVNLKKALQDFKQIIKDDFNSFKNKFF